MITRRLAIALLLVALPLLLVACYGDIHGPGGRGDDDDGSGDDDDSAADDDDGAPDDDDGAPDDDDGAPDDDDTEPECEPDGLTECWGNEFVECSNSLWTLVDTCVDPTPICDGHLGCVSCSPGLVMCEDNNVVECAGDGMSTTLLEECDPGDICVGGECLSACDMAEQQMTYLGCNFLAVTTANIVGGAFDNDFAVVIGAPADGVDADVTVSRGGSVVSSTTVPAGQVAAIELPMVSEIKNAGQSVTVVDGAYEVLSSVPVAAYQYSPLHFNLAGTNSYTNDASLLLPEHTLTGNYMISTWPTWGYGDWTDFLGVPMGDWSNWYPGFVAVAATVDGTQVTFESSTYTHSGTPGALNPGGTTTVTLNRGDVVQIFSQRPDEDEDWDYCSSQGWTATENDCPPGSVFLSECEAYCSVDDGDLTGSIVSATAPVAVWGGHMCTFMPYDQWACDHLEEMAFPTETWGYLSVMSAPTHPNGSAVAPTLYRVMALSGGTTVTFDPAVIGSTTLGAGEFVQFESNQDFVVEGTDKIFVTQTLLGEDALSGEGGDPAMGSGIPWLQVRDTYDFLTPESYTANYVNVVAPDGATVDLDGNVLGGWEPIGTTGYSVSRVAIDPGQHHIESPGTGFGITTYGYASYTSYLYPGGMNFTR